MKVVWVKWIDSESIHGWQNKATFSDFAGTQIKPCDSVGMLVHDSRSHVTILQSVSEDGADGNIKIPKVAILSMKKIADVEVELK